MMRLKIFFTLFCMVSVAMAQQPGKMIKKFFPAPDVEINTPSFQQKGIYITKN